MKDGVARRSGGFRGVSGGNGSRWQGFCLTRGVSPPSCLHTPPWTFRGVCTNNTVGFKGRVNASRDAFVYWHLTPSTVMPWYVYSLYFDY